MGDCSLCSGFLASKKGQKHIMIILPAIDILDGRCVRLVKGDYGTAHQVAADPLETAMRFEADGAEYLHMVDLNGAAEGGARNAEIFCRVARTLAIPVELGGGIRDMKTVSYYLEHGIKRVILGSAALGQPSFVREAVKEFGAGIAVGIDARGGKVSVSGWTETSETDYLTFAKQMEACGVQNLIFTDISRDGTLVGPNLDQLEALKNAVSSDITASGGIKNAGDIHSLAALGLYGAICGKSLYSGTLTVKEALAAAVL